MLIGDTFVGTFASADASALSEPNSRYTLYVPGSTNTVTLGSTDVVHISDIFISSTGAIAVTLYDGADNSVGAGEKIVKVDCAAKAVVTIPLHVSHQCAVGTYPKVLGSGAGQIETMIRGTISRKGT